MYSLNIDRFLSFICHIFYTCNDLITCRPASRLTRLCSILKA